MELSREVFQLIERLKFEPRIKSLQPMSGRYRSHKTGHSPDFMEFRDYRHGEPAQSIDWRASGKLDRQLVRKNEHRGLIKNWIVIDGSGSMAFPEKKSKFKFQCMLTGALMYLLNGQGDPVGIHLIHEKNGMTFNPSRTWLGLSEMIRYISASSPVGKTDLKSSIETLAAKLQKGSHIWILTDFDYGLQDIEQTLGYIKSEGHDIRALHLFHPWEKNLPWNGECRFEDLETQFDSFTLRPEVLAEEYATFYENHIQQLQTTMTEKGVLYFHLDVTQPITDHLLEILQGQ